ncbi:MAG: alkaline phosphatase family protein [Candidatus Promineifilaceae bacterium]|nr:alkaline phosphatase family protein [Candidatus Promineifilaceae bacterium]
MPDSTDADTLHEEAGSLQRPDYGGGTIANIPATTAALLGAPFDGLPPLREAAWQPLADGVKRVVVLVVDAMGWNLVQRVLDEQSWVWTRALARERVSSVFPSTTVAALTSMWTGTAPAQHGLIAFHLFLPEFAVLGQMIHFTPVFAHWPGGLVQAGLEPESFLPVPGTAEQLAQAGIPTYSFKPYQIVDSHLSKIHGRGVAETLPIVTAADLCVRIRALLEEKAGQRLYAHAYWPAVDSLSHMHGWDAEPVAAEVRSLFQVVEQELWQPLSAAAREGTALFITADHGQTLTPAAQAISLTDHPELQAMLLMRPAGEPRTPYFYARQGQQAQIVAYLRDKLGHAMTVWPAAEALAAGLFGPPPYAPDVALRLGDVVATMHAGYILLTADEEEDRSVNFRARHGGMTRAEMEAPWLGYRLDT